MRKLKITILLFLLSATLINAQTVVFSEDFETLPLSVTSSGTPGWALNTRLQVSGANSDSAYIASPGDISYLETASIDLTGLYYVTLTFNHICKAEFFDEGTIEVSTNGGSTWTKLIDTDGNPGGFNNCLYLGTGLFRGQGSKFQEANYSIWEPGTAAAVPQNSWWQSELLDVSQLAGGESDVRFRFRLADANNTGGAGRAGWFIDDIEVGADSCEFNAPFINQVAPLYPAVVYNLGPFIINVQAVDQSGFNSITVFYTLNGVPQPPLLMTQVQGVNYTASIPGASPGDEICYYIEAIDGSNCDNTTYEPGPTSAETVCFIAQQGVVFPYCDNFDGSGVPWTGSGTAGTIWELGPPNSGSINTANSPPNAWVTNLNSQYTNSATTTLLSPEFSFQVGVGATLEFWHNRNTQVNADGTRLEWATDLNGPWNLLGSVGCINCENWFNTAVVTSSNLPGWTGNSNGWVKSSIILDANFNNQPQVWFRFVFTSNNATTGDGMAIDNFCITLPEPNDIGVIAIPEPGNSGTAGNCVNVIVQVKNFGLNSQTGFPVTCVVQGTPYTATFPGNLAPGAVSFFTIPCVSIPEGAFNICAYTELPGDANPLNDTTCSNGFGFPVIPITFSTQYFDNFDGPNTGWLSTGSGTATSMWELGAPNYGTTNSSYSQPNSWDINLNSAYTNNAACELISPYFDFTNAADAEVSFWRNHSCQLGSDGTRLEYKIGTNGTWTLLGGANLTQPCWMDWYNSTPNIAGGQPAWTGVSSGSGTGQGWVKSEAKCLSFLNNAGLVQFRFLFTSDGSTTGDGFSVDDFRIQIPVPLTASPVVVNTNAINNNFIFPGQTIQFSSPISNTGTTPLSSVLASLYVDWNLIVTDTIYYSPSLPSFQNLLHSFAQNWIATPGVHQVCVVTSQPNFASDQNPSDDTTCIYIAVFDTVTVTSGNPYCQDFEGGPQWVTVNALTYNNMLNSWQIGTPAQTIMNGANSGTNAWMTNLTGNYPNRDTSGLFSPVFPVDATKCYRLSFWHKFDTELYQDGGIVEYSTDFAQTWGHLGFASANPNWFNTAFITALGGTPGLPGWSGLQSTWLKAEHDVNFPSNANVIFRFRFASDNSVNNHEGWVIDDFCFEEVPTPCVVGINDPGEVAGITLGQNYPNPFTNETSIDFLLPEEGFARLSVTNLLGQEVFVPVNENKTAGMHRVTIQSQTLRPGIYYYTLEFNNQKLVKKMVIAR